MGRNLTVHCTGKKFKKHKWQVSIEGDIKNLTRNQQTFPATYFYNTINITEALGNTVFWKLDWEDIL